MKKVVIFKPLPRSHRASRFQLPWQPVL
jgi:hypothetical protein